MILLGLWALHHQVSEIYMHSKMHVNDYISKNIFLSYFVLLPCCLCFLLGIHMYISRIYLPLNFIYQKMSPFEFQDSG